MSTDIVLSDSVVVIAAPDEHTLRAYFRNKDGATAYAKRRNKRCVWHIHHRVSGKWREVATVRGDQPEEQQRWLLTRILRALAE